MSPEQIIFVKASLSGLTGKIDSQFYLSGTSEVSVNDWHGQAKFDGTNKVQWQLKKNKVTESGVLALE